MLRVLIPALTLMAACGQPDGGQAQPALSQPTRAAPTSALAMRQSFAPVVKKAAPAVVNISARGVVRQRDPFWEMFGLGVPRERMVSSLGSGVIVRADGVIVTNYHVIENAREVSVALADRREFPAEVLLKDPHTDLAILKIDTKGERLATLAIDDSGDTEVGDLVLAIGDPFGVGQTVTNGIISALNRTVDPSGEAPSTFIQTDAAINPGNSGGALVDMDGDLIGVNSFILSGSGTSSGVGFAIPAAVVRRVVETAAGGGRAVVRPWLGARLQSVTPEISASLGMATPSGALVTDVWPGGSAARAGLMQGDVVLSVDDQQVVDAAGVTFAISNHRPGEVVRIGIRRGAGQRQVSLRAEAPPATPSRDERTISGRNPFDGATVVNLSPAVADELGIDLFSGPGVLVTNVGRGFALQAGFRPGDIIRAVNRRRVENVRELISALNASGRRWAVTIERGNQTITGAFTV